MRTHNIPSCYRKSKRSLLCLLTWCFHQPYQLELPLSRTNFHGPKGVQAIEVRLYIQTNTYLNLCCFNLHTSTDCITNLTALSLTSRKPHSQADTNNRPWTIEISGRLNSLDAKTEIQMFLPSVLRQTDILNPLRQIRDCHLSFTSKFPDFSLTFYSLPYPLTYKKSFLFITLMVLTASLQNWRLIP